MMRGSMTAAFVLGINMSVAGIFAVAFAVVAATNRTARGAWWLALGYGMGIVYVALEFLLTRQVDPTPAGIGIFQIGRAPCRERGCQHVSIPVVAGPFKKTNIKNL